MRVSVERPDARRDVNVLGTISVLEAARRARHAGRLQLDRRRDLRRVRRAGARGRRAAAARAVRRLEARRRGVPGRLQPALRVAPRLAAATATSTGRGRTRTARPASSRSSSAAWPRRGAADDLRRRPTDPRLRLRGRRGAGDAGRGGPATAAVFNVGTGDETSVLELYELCRRVAGADVEAEEAPARLGELQRSVLDSRCAERELGWRPRSRWKRAYA